METFFHYIYRFALHLWVAPGIVFSVAFALRFIRRKAHLSWLPERQLQTLWLSALLVLPVAFFREPFDVDAGGTVVKSVLDFVSWICGVGLAPFCASKLKPWD